MNEQNPLISVIIPVYNCELYLAAAIESVLAQTYRPLEIIVVDDGSTDDSAEIAKGYASEVRLLTQPNRGAAAARNHGAAAAQGDFLAFLDADDLWGEDKLARQMMVLAADPELDMVFGHVQQFHSPDLNADIKAKVGYAQEIMPGYHVGTMLIRKDSFFRAGQFATNWRTAEFIDWYSRAVEQGLKNVMLPEVLMKRRIHANNMGIRERDHRVEYVRVLKAALDRRRAVRAKLA